ncbi:MAG TPA: prolyl oligopeptidase family serine peptidase [Vicinamibacterales bacterium]|jgi:dipeptidyl aminopeptidase/acylaminoacyl peptidase/tetratricopeptide (TPR) repeat protein
MRLRAFVLFALVLLVPALVMAADTRPLKVDDQFALREVGDPRISPDGKWVAYTVTRRDPIKDKADTDIYTAPLGGGASIRLTTSDKPEHRPRFSPDGKWLAFISGREGSHAQVWLLNRAGGEAFKLTDYKAGVSDLAWSPDSTRLALVVSDVDPDAPGDEAQAPTGDKKTEKPIVINRLQFKRDTEGYLREIRNHIVVFDIQAKRSMAVTSGAFDDGEPAWSPDGTLVAFSSNRTLPDPDVNQNTDIFVVPARGGVPRAIARSARAESSPVFSPDGKLIAYVASGDPKDMWYGASHIEVAPVGGGTPRALTDALDRNVASPRFSADGGSVFFMLEDGGNQHVARVPVGGGTIERVAAGEREISAFDLGPNGELVVLESTWLHPEEVSSVRDGALRRITTVNDEVLGGVALGRLERFKAKSADGTIVDGFLTLPPGYAAGVKLPAILRIHGGPTSQYTTGFNWEWQILAAQGYAVIAANPRGSTGYGTAYSRAIWADWGNRDFQDVMAAVDHAVAMGVADPDRLGVGGWSYGGILTDYVISKTTRFKAATSGASASNILAGYGTDHYQYEYEVEIGLPWKTRDTWLRLSSFFDVEKVVTPTLFLCGQQDMNVPLLNTEQLYQAVRRVGKAETELVIYPGQWHSIRTPSYRKDLDDRYIAWYNRHLKPATLLAGERRPEATSLAGVPLYPPDLTAEARKAADDNLAKAREDFVQAPDSADAIVWLGRRAAVAGHVREAIDIFTRGIARFPNDARLYRHRGHRYVTVREFDKAVADLTKATRLVEGKPDQPEPTTSDPKVMSSETLNYAIWYHLGLAHYLKGDFERALEAYQQCRAVARGNDDQVVGASDWLYMTLRRLGRADQAAKVLEAIVPGMKVKDDQQYYDRLMMYKGAYEPEDLLRAGGDPVSAATYAYGVANWYLYNGRKDEAKALFARIVKGPNWMPFGFIAAETELARMK